MGSRETLWATRRAVGRVFTGYYWGASSRNFKCRLWWCVRRREADDRRRVVAQGWGSSRMVVVKKVTWNKTKRRTTKSETPSRWKARRSQRQRDRLDAAQCPPLSRFIAIDLYRWLFTIIFPFKIIVIPSFDLFDDSSSSSFSCRVHL